MTSNVDRPRLGAFVENGGVVFGVYTTNAADVAVQLYDDAGTALHTHPMHDVGGGYFEEWLASVGVGALYRFVLDGRALPDPYARFLPHGVHGPARVEQSDYRWRAGSGVSRAAVDHVFYELHVGTFTPEGNYAAAATRLSTLADLGVTTIELMPVAAFAGERGWGYDGVAHYAPFAPYGAPNDLRAFIDSAHEVGLSVILDVVYNHFGPSGNYLPSYAPECFVHASNTAWGDAPNFTHPVLRRYVLDNVRYWLEEFRFDGLRLDAVHAIHDTSARHLVREIADLVATIEPRKLLVGEDERNDPASVRESGLHAVWADDFHHQVHVALTGEQEGYYAGYRPNVEDLATVIENGWIYDGRTYPPSGKGRGRPALDLPAECFVYCIQNHDQVGNRALGDRLTVTASLDAYRAVSTLLLFLPVPPLLFMGQEWAATTPFLYFTDHDADLGAKVREGRRGEFRAFSAFADAERRDQIPDPQSRATFEASRLAWEERTEEPHNAVVELYKNLLTFRRQDPVLHNGGRESLSVKAEGGLLIVRRWWKGEVRQLTVNLGDGGVAMVDIVPPKARVLRTSSANGVDPMLMPRNAVIYGWNEEDGVARPG